MHTKNEKFIKHPMLTAALLAAFAFGSSASASVVRLHFNGAVGSGYVDLTLGVDQDASTNYQPTFDSTSPGGLSPYDPAGAQHITGASGTFSGSGIDSPITGIIPTSPGQAPPGETLPKSFSWLTAGTNSYDNLFYADGSPLVCPPAGKHPYTFSGGYLDIFGAMFALKNGDVVSLWSDGVTSPGGMFGPTWPGGLTYGLSVFAPTAAGYALISPGSTQFAGVTATVPEPGLVWLFGAGVLGLFAWRRKMESKA